MAVVHPIEMSTNLVAKTGYKRLLKAAQLAFRNDKTALAQAKIQLKVEFTKNKNVTDRDELQVHTHLAVLERTFQSFATCRNYLKELMKLTNFCDSIWSKDS